MPAPGRVVILNGVSSAGKTTLASDFVEQRAEAGDLWILTGLDDFIAKLPWQWLDIPGYRGPFGRDGLRFDEVPDGLLPTVGDVGWRVFAVYRRSVAAWARAGFNVVVDEVVCDKETVDDWGVALSGLDVTWVGVRCETVVAAAREQARGNRVIGLASGQSSVVHAFTSYDLEVDTTDASPLEVLARLAAFLSGRA